MLNLVQNNSKLGNLILNYPLKLIPIMEKAVNSLQYSLLSFSTHDDPLSHKRNVHIRLNNLPNVNVYNKMGMPNNDDIGKLISVQGTILRTGETKIITNTAIAECTKCKGIFNLTSNLDKHSTIKPPVVCLNDEKPNCLNSRFNITKTNDRHHFRQYQEIKIQQNMSNLSIGSMPKTVVAILEDDLVDQVKSGDKVKIIGCLRRRWKEVNAGQRCIVEMYFHVNNVIIKSDLTIFNNTVVNSFTQFWSIHKDRPFLARDKIVNSFCPKVYGLHLVKLCCLLTIIGGVSKSSESGHKVRGEPHLLLVGDPGTAKSQFLKFSNKLVQRSILTTGIGTSSVGLTVAATKDKGGFVLEPGALVLADGGLCCIDEFNSIQERDKTSVYEAMEQQRISIAKAGIVCTLNTRCSVLAATNPKGNYDPNQSLSTNLALAGPLLSRFDMILIILDDKDSEWDDKIADYILMRELDGIKNDENNTEFNIEQLRDYINYVQNEYQPRISKEVDLIFTKYYHLVRMKEQDKSRTTVRFLEALIRLAQAHARLCFKNQVDYIDACQIILLMEIATAGNFFIPRLVSNPVKLIKSTFFENPDEEAKEQAGIILGALGLSNILLE
ncbi:MCM-domain-containing protein [Neoconidiobolus thromboides FSU 785]|nr:MCM-domain-containing protein [Neoconidiobolus thromboides FSU 785]